MWYQEETVIQLARVLLNCLSLVLARYVKESVMGEAITWTIDYRLAKVF